MSYTLKLSNGKILVTLPDQKTDAVTTSLTLIGKNVNAYGTDINDNFVRLLENFAYQYEPTSPLIGQLWFNTVEQRMYVFGGSGTTRQAKPVGGTIVSASQPTSLTAGDLWIDTTAQQLKYTPDGSTIVVAGPAYSTAQGKSGWVIDSVEDTSHALHTITGLWSNNNLLGILSDTAFTLNAPYGSTSSGMTSVSVGLTLNGNTSTNIKLVGTATNADSLNGVTGAQFLRNDTNQVISAKLWVNTNTNALSVGTNEDFQFYVESGVATLFIGGADEDFNLKLNSPNTASALYFNSANERIGVFNINPQYPLDINGTVNIQGDLIVSGSSTVVSNLQVDNKIIELAYGQSVPDDSFINNGGVVLHGTTDKTLLWSTDRWNSSEHINLPSNKTYQIAGFPVITSNALGSVITSAPGLTSVGHLTSATIAQLQFTTSTIGTTNSVPLILGSGSATSLDFNGKPAYNAVTPVPADPGTMVATKEYVDTEVSTARSGQFALNIDITNTATFYTSSDDPAIDSAVLTYLQIMLPPGDPSPYGIANNGRARVMVTQYRTLPQSNVVSSPIGFSSVTVDKNGVLNSQSVIAYSSPIVASTNIPAGTLRVNKAIKQYIVSGGVWLVLPYSGPSNTVYTDGTW
jgi:hypothetical protein